MAVGLGGGSDVTVHSLKLVLHQALGGEFRPKALMQWLQTRNVKLSICSDEWSDLANEWRGVFSQGARARNAPLAAARACIGSPDAESALRFFVPNNGFLTDAFREALASGGTDIQSDSAALHKLRRMLEMGKFGVVPFPSKIPDFVRGPSAIANTPKQFGILQLAKRGQLDARLYDAMTPFMEELSALADKLGEPIHLERDGAPLAAGTIDQVGQIVSRVCGFAALFFGLPPSLRLWRNGALLAQYFAFLVCKGAAVKTKLLFCRHSIRLVKEEVTKASSSEEEAACKIVLEQLLILSQQVNIYTLNTLFSSEHAFGNSYCN